MASAVKLSIVRGIKKVPGDTFSTEQGVTEINLLNTLGFSVAENGWIPKMPQLKGGGLWADTTASANDILLSTSFGRITETIKLTSTASNFLSRYYLVSLLFQYAQFARDFHTEWKQAEPVYLEWEAPNAAGPQYALIYTIDIVPGLDANTPENINELTITITREQFWPGISPGSNPKLWTNPVLTVAKADLQSATDNLFTATVNNRREWNAARSALTSQNHVTIPAASIPGDAPALCLITMTKTAGSNSYPDMIVGRSTKPILLDESGDEAPPDLMLNAGDAQLGTDCSTVADTGAPKSTGAATNIRGRCTFATATHIARFTWKDVATTRGYFNLSASRGSYICLLRARLSAAGTVVLSLTAQLANVLTLPQQTLTSVGAGGTGNTTEWSVVYLGVLTVPLGPSKIMVSDDGLGASISGDIAGGELILSASRTSGAADLYVSDLILIPIDECAAGLNTGSVNLFSTGSFIHFDTTGYFQHGQSGGIGIQPSLDSIGLTGQPIYLEPRVDNQLFFFCYDAATPQASIDGDYSVYINIVPRWAGIRDV